MLVTLTIAPERRRIIPRAAARQVWKVPLRFVASTSRQSSSRMRASSPSRVIPAVLTRMARPPASRTRRLRGVRDAGLDGAAARLLRDGRGLVGPGAIADDDARARVRQLEHDGVTDPPRPARDERGLAFERAEAHATMQLVPRAPSRAS